MNKVERITSDHGVLYHINDGYFYKETNRRRTKLYLTCYKPNCNVKGVTDIHMRGPIILFDCIKHNHKQSKNQFMVNKLITSILRRCNTEITDIKQIFNEEMSKLPRKIVSTYSDSIFLKVLRLNQTKNGPLPLVKSITEYADVLMKQYFAWLSKTKTDRKFFIGIIENHSVLFISPTTKSLINETDVPYIFAVNRTCNFISKEFDASVIISILAIYDNKEFPVAFAIMKDQCTDKYKQLLNAILHELPQWNPAVIIANFDRDIRTAIKDVLPSSCRIVGNWYHFSRDIRNRLSNLGLVRVIKDDKDLHKYVKMCIALPLLPANMIQTGFVYISKLILSKQNTNKFTTLLDFIQECWLNDIKPEHISVNYDPNRINNYCEEYTGFLVQLIGSRRCGKTRSSIVTFTDGLTKVENMYSEMYTATRNRIQTNKISCKRTIKDLRILHAIRLYQNERIHFLSFLEMLSYATMEISHYDIDGDFAILSTTNSCKKQSSTAQSCNKNNFSFNELHKCALTEDDSIENVITEEIEVLHDNFTIISTPNSYKKQSLTAQSQSHNKNNNSSFYEPNECASTDSDCIENMIVEVFHEEHYEESE